LDLQLTAVHRVNTDADGRRLLLGEWCRIFGDAPRNSGDEIIPYHWDDRQKLTRDYLYLKQLYEEALASLGKALNVLHDVQFSERYWRIILGPWLHWFLVAVFDRMECLRRAAESARVTSVHVWETPYGSFTPNDMGQFSRAAVGDAYNHVLFSRLIQRTRILPFSTTPCATGLSSIMPVPAGDGKRQRSRWNLNNLAVHWNRYVFPASSLSNVRLVLRLGQLPWNEVGEEPSDYPMEVGKRKGLQFQLVKHNQYEELIEALVPEQVPKAYVEGYRSMRTRAKELFPRHAKVICTSTGYWQAEFFKFWAAEQREKGAAYAIVQHGGTYGMARWFFEEEHQRKSADIFYSWGWRAGIRENVRPLPSPYLSTIKGSISPLCKGKIVLIESTNPRYAYHLYATYIGASGYAAYLAGHFAFIRALQPPVRKALEIRLYRQDYGMRQAARFRSEFPDVACDCGTDNLFQKMRASRLLITTYNGTTFLESFSCNFPTILFWDPKVWELRTEAEPFFRELGEVGIFHSSATAAAGFVNDIFSDPMHWWMTEPVQKARRRFCGRFAQTSRRWSRVWSEELRQVYSGRERSTIV